MVYLDTIFVWFLHIFHFFLYSAVTSHKLECTVFESCPNPLKYPFSPKMVRTRYYVSLYMLPSKHRGYQTYKGICSIPVLHLFISYSSRVKKSRGWGSRRRYKKMWMLNRKVIKRKKLKPINTCMCRITGPHAIL